MEDPQTREVYLKATIQKIKEAYAEVIAKPAKPARTPGYLGKCLSKTTEDEEEIKTMLYQLIVGKVMYYMTNVGLELANAVRELA